MKRFASVLALATVLVIATVAQAAAAAAATRPDDRAVHGPAVAGSETTARNAPRRPRMARRRCRARGRGCRCGGGCSDGGHKRGFNWADAGVGAAAAALVVLLAVGAAFAVRRQRVPAT